jgi:TonB family protein
MKRCGACGEEFQNHFNFCPVDGETLIERESDVINYSPTIISDVSLAQRLLVQLSFLIERLRLSWAQFIVDPIAFLKLQITAVRELYRTASAPPYLRKALAASLVLVALVIVSVVIFDQHGARRAQPADADQLDQAALIDAQMFPNDEPKSGSGIGANEQGRVGFNKGKGEGSGPTPARSHGGGGGGDGSELPAVQGRLPQPSEIPAPISTTFARLPPRTLPEAGINIDPVLWKDLPFPNYGDPRSKSTVASNGPGEEGGVGTGKGTGIGPGEDNGYGRGRRGNIGGGDKGIGCCGESGGNGNKPGEDIERVFRQADVTTRARVISKPEPQYTEEARKAAITGTVILSVVFSRTGQVTNVRAVQTLCCGLTEKAIAAARSIRFIPAMRNGQVVSTYMQLEYNFNLY